MRKRKPHTLETKLRISISNTGILSSQWKGNKAKYQALHTWIRKYHGSADRCENPDCKGISNDFQWALKPGRKYSRNIKDYKQLCRSCHRKMDVTPETREKISNSNRKHIGCKYQGCNSPHWSKEYCSHHYNTIVRKENRFK